MIIKLTNVTQNAKFLTRGHGSGKTDRQEHFGKKLFDILALGLTWSRILSKNPQVLQKKAFNKVTVGSR